MCPPFFAKLKRPGAVGNVLVADWVGTNAQFSYPYNLDSDADENIYVADYANFRIFMIMDGQVTTLAGNGTAGYVDEDGKDAGFGRVVWNSN